MDVIFEDDFFQKINEIDPELEAELDKQFKHELVDESLFKRLIMHPYLSPSIKATFNVELSENTNQKCESNNVVKCYKNNSCDDRCNLLGGVFSFTALYIHRYCSNPYYSANEKGNLADGPHEILCFCGFLSIGILVFSGVRIFNIRFSFVFFNLYYPLPYTTLVLCNDDECSVDFPFCCLWYDEWRDNSE